MIKVTLLCGQVLSERAVWRLQQGKGLQAHGDNGIVGE